MTEIHVKKSVADPDALVLVQAKVPEDLSYWVKENFPHGFKQDFVRACFARLKELVDSGALPKMEVYVNEVVESIVDDIMPDYNDDEVND